MFSRISKKSTNPQFPVSDPPAHRPLNPQTLRPAELRTLSPSDSHTPSDPQAKPPHLQTFRPHNCQPPEPQTLERLCALCILPAAAVCAATRFREFPRLRLTPPRPPPSLTPSLPPSLPPLSLRYGRFRTDLVRK